MPESHRPSEAPERLMTKEEITDWLRSIGKDRHWLATKVPTTYGTLNQWFSKGFPEWALVSITRLARPQGDLSAGLELSFTAGEMSEIFQAMEKGGFKSLKQFYKTGITELARRIVEKEAELPLEKQPAPSPVKSGHGSSSTAPDADSSSTIVHLPPQHLAAEESAKYRTRRR